MDNPDPTTKRCSDCGEVLPLDQFHKSTGSPDGHKARCKACRCGYTRQYAQTHKEQRRAYDAVWREKNRESENNRLAEFRKLHRDELRASGRAFYYKIKERELEKRAQPENKAKKSEYDKARYHANPERFRQGMREYRVRNPEKIHESEKRRRSDRERMRPVERNARARRRGSPGKHTAKDIALQMKSQRGKCWWCGIQIDGKYHVDHRIPLARGGSNDPGNLVITCVKCNLQKNSKLPHEWNGRLL